MRALKAIGARLTPRAPPWGWAAGRQPSPHVGRAWREDSRTRPQASFPPCSSDGCPEAEPRRTAEGLAGPPQARGWPVAKPGERRVPAASERGVMLAVAEPGRRGGWHVVSVISRRSRGGLGFGRREGVPKAASRRDSSRVLSSGRVPCGSRVRLVPLGSHRHTREFGVSGGKCSGDPGALRLCSGPWVLVCPGSLLSTLSRCQTPGLVPGPLRGVCNKSLMELLLPASLPSTGNSGPDSA